MNNFHFTKIIAGVGPILAKETVLSKVINMVDVFRITLSWWFDDNNKKYIDTIMKLDNSKTIMLETKGNDIRIKNLANFKVRKNETIELEYSEYAQEGDKKIFIDYPSVGNLPKWVTIVFEQSEVSIQVKWKTDKPDTVECKVLEWWEILQFDRVTFSNFDINMWVLTDKDKKDILRWLEYGVHLFALSNIENKDHILELKAFLEQQNNWEMKIIAKIENEKALLNLNSITDVSDWVIIMFDKIEKAMRKHKINHEEIITKVRNKWKPILISFIDWLWTKKYPFVQEEVIKKFCALSVDGIVLEHMIKEEDPLDIITKTSDLLDKYELRIKKQETERFDKDDDFMVRDYIIYNAHRITKDIDVKAIVCYTENWYTSARLSSLNPQVPVITFTKSNETYRYLNAIRWVKWYKISPNFDYENLKRIGKEMIRIIFKGNISLDDKILIIQANELLKDEKSNMINWIELYKFKNI